MLMLLLAIAIRAALIAAGTGLVLTALWVKTPALRHAAWTSVVIAMLILPLWSTAGPSIRVPVLPASPAVLEASTTTNPGATIEGQAAIAGRSGIGLAATTASVSDGAARGTITLILLYASVALLLLTRLGIGTIQAHRLRREAVERAGRATSARCATPVTVGWLSPVLILPEGWQRWSPRHLDAVVTHECEHARRRDPLMQWVALFNRAIFWFHPLAWWLEWKLANLAEESCDAAVIRAGHSPQDYSDYLIEMARALSRQGRRLDVVGMAMPGSNLATRLRFIFEEIPMRSPTRTRAICTLALCALSSIVFAAGTLTSRSVPVATSPAAPVFHAQRVETPSQPVLQSPDLLKPERVAPPTPVDEAEMRAPEPASMVHVHPPMESLATSVDEMPQAGMTDFSGTWKLDSSTTMGPARGAGGGNTDGSMVEKKTTAIWSSGAPVNCGPQCTLTQDARTLTISRVGTPDEITKYDNGVVALNLDGSDSTVNYANDGKYTVQAKRNGGQIVVTYKSAYFTVTQVLFIDGGALKVVTDFGVGDAPVTFTYLKE